MQQNLGFPKRVGSGPGEGNTTCDVRVQLCPLRVNHLFWGYYWTAAEKLSSALSGSVGWLSEHRNPHFCSPIRASYQSQSFPSHPSWGAGTGWLYQLHHHSCRETRLNSNQRVPGLPDKRGMKVTLTMQYSRLCWTGGAAHRHPCWTHQRGWCASKRLQLKNNIEWLKLMEKHMRFLVNKAQHLYLERSNYKPHVTIDEGPASMELLIVRQQQLHVGLQQ